MGLGATASVIGAEKSLVIVWDTGEIKDDKPVLSRHTIKVEDDISAQEAYDAAYNIASLTDYTISNIYLVTQEILSPID